MRSDPHADEDFKPPRWMVLTVAGIGGAVLLAASLAWFARGSTIVNDIADFLCL